MYHFSYCDVLPTSPAMSGVLSFIGAAMDDMSASEQAILSEFGRDVFDAAVRAGYVVPPWKPSNESCSMLHEYLLFGFDAIQAAEALFAVRH